MNSGENVAKNKSCSAQALTIIQKSWSQRHGRFGEIQDRQNAPYASCMQFGDLRLGISSDGIGTKIELAERMSRYDSLGFDLIAMVVDDLAAQGFEPSNVSNVLDVDRLDDGIIQALMQGLTQAAQQAQVALSGGEIAELGDRVGGWGGQMHFNWSATALGFLPGGRKLLDGHMLQAGDQLVALASNGLRSNGFSLARRILHQQFGDDWHQQKIAAHQVPTAANDDNNKPDAEQSWGDYLLKPSRIFSPIVQAALQQNLDLHDLAHITGGGLLGALHRLLGAGKLGVNIDNLFAAPAPLRALQKMAGLDDISAYRQWNMGQGFLLALPAGDIAPLRDICAAQHCPMRMIGQIQPKPEICIDSRGLSPKKLHFANSLEASGFFDPDQQA